MHIHILGICGTFMGGLAVLARAAGHRVTGCDAGVYPPMSTQLEAQGIALIEGWDPTQLALLPDLFVVGNVVARGNPLMEAILDRGLAYTSGPQWLAEHVLAGKTVLAVAGTHGKTTTSAMLAWILEDAGLAPGFLIGGVPNDFGVSARFTDSPYFVIEADEYDTAFFDKRSKFVHYRPRVAVLNNLEYDHADIFADLAAIETQFHHLVRTVPAQGLLVVNGASDALARVLARGCWSNVERFGDGADWSARNKDPATDAGFDVLHAGSVEATIAWKLQGEHNSANALAALIAARYAGVAIAQACKALARFEGVKRRMEVRGIVDGVTVYDDFAHHPTAIATTITGLKHKLAPSTETRGESRIVAVIEPRSNTMKLGTMKAALAASLADADRVFGYGAKHGKDALGWDLAAALSPLNEGRDPGATGVKAAAFDAIDQLVAAIVIAAQPGDHVLVMSNGGFGGIHDRLLAALAMRAAQGRGVMRM
ncbi:MAG: UDP-N-acetylmuramate:L-alanyl-gamma-D-glutamyl-meso-diaminopimelate ligase [Burkholderiaceae bacterium]